LRDNEYYFCDTNVFHMKQKLRMKENKEYKLFMLTS